MYSDSNSNRVYSAHQRSKTRTIHLGDKSPSDNEALFFSQSFEKEALIRKIQLLSEENKSLKEQIESFDIEYSNLINCKSEEIESLQMEKLEIEREIRLLKEKNSEINIDLTVQKDENERILRENEELYDKIEILTRSIDKFKSSNTSLSLKLEKANNNSLYVNKEYENKNQKAQEYYNKKLADVKAIYKKKIRALKNELKSFKTLNKDLEISESKRLALQQEYEAYKLKVFEENKRLIDEHTTQMKRLEDISLSKLNELENQLDQTVRNENENSNNKIRSLQKELKEAQEKLVEKERFFSHLKESSEKDMETLQKALETLQKTNETQRKKIFDQQDRFSKDLDRKQKEIESLNKELEGIRIENEDKTYAIKEEMQRLTQTSKDKEKEIENLKNLLFQKAKAIDENFANTQLLQEKYTENQRLQYENDALKTEKNTRFKELESYKQRVKELDANLIDFERAFSSEKDKFIKVSKELQEKNLQISNLNKKIEISGQRSTELQAENALLLEQKIEAQRQIKTLEIEKSNLVNKLQDFQLQLKIQEKRFKDELTAQRKEFEGKYSVEEAHNIRKIQELELQLQGFEGREKEYKELLEQKQARLRTVQSKQQNLKEKTLATLRLIRQNLKDFKGAWGSMNIHVLLEALGLEIQEKLIGFSGNLTRKMAGERHKIERFYLDEKTKIKDKFQKELEELSNKLKENESILNRINDEKAKKEQRESEENNKNLAAEINKLKAFAKEKDRENHEIKISFEKIKRKLDDENQNLKANLQKNEEMRVKEKEKAFRDLTALRKEIDELYRKNKQIFDEFARNIEALRDNQEQELCNINNYNDEIIDVLKEKLKFYEENGDLLTKDYNVKAEDLEKQNALLQEQLKSIKTYYEDQINILENKHNQTLFQNTMEADKNLRNLGLKAQEIEKLELKIKDLETVIKNKTAQIEELSSKNSSIEGKLRNLQFQLELRNNNLNMKQMQISEEISSYKDELLENPSLMPSNSFKSKHFSKVSALPLTNNNNNYNADNIYGSDVFNKRINELRQISQSISTNPLNTFKELPTAGDDEKINGLEMGKNQNLHRYSKSSSNFLQYANKLAEKMNSGFNSHRDNRDERVRTEKKTNFHKKDQKSSLI